MKQRSAVAEPRDNRPRLARLLSHVFIDRDYGLLALGHFVSTLGDRVFDTTLILWITLELARGKSWAPLAVSGVLVAATAPSLASPVAGVFVDRWDRRVTMMVSDIARAVLVFVLILLVSVAGSLHLPPGGRLGLIYATVALAAACTLFFQPARAGVIQEIVEPAQRPQASSTAFTLRSIASLAGPPAAALLLVTVGVGWALAINALSFLLSSLAIATVRVPPRTVSPKERTSGIRAEIGEGLSFYRQNPVLRVITLSAVLALLGAGATSALGVFFLIENLHAPARFFGIMGSANAAGIMVGALTGGAVVAKLGLQRTFCWTLSAIGCAILVYSRATNLPTALVIDFFVGVTAGLLNVPMMPLIMAVTPRAVIGRVFAVFSPLLDFASLASTVPAGYLVSTISPASHVHVGFLTFGRVDTVFAVSGVLSLVAGLYAFRSLSRVPVDGN